MTLNLKTSLTALVCLLICLCSMPASAQQKNVSLSTLTQGQKLEGFKAVAIYLNDADQPMGGRFIHERTGFVLDLLQMESVPQTYIYVNAHPVSNKGEPHTQEHLLITKGNKGHALNTREGMSLAESNAFTGQLQTVYNFNTGAGASVFYTLFEKYMDALLYPDYTNEEVSREVRNWGVTQNPDKTLRLEEKGSVYNEMSSTMNNPYSLLYDTLGRLQYGVGHPISLNAGGLPPDIRVLNATDIAKFHADNYYLGNMGAITALPQSMTLKSVLLKMDQILTSLNKGAASHANSNTKLPPPRPAEKGKIAVIDFPSENAQQPGTMMFSFAPTLTLSVIDQVKMANFLSVFAGDATTNLYKVFVDSKTKIPGIDAQAVFAYMDSKMGHPVMLGLDGISATYLTQEKAIMVRAKIMEELQKVADYKDHSPQLLAFNKRFESSLQSQNRSDAKFVNSPPKFGFRNTGEAWFNELKILEDVPGFKKSVTLKPQSQLIRQQLATGVNIWKPLLAKLSLANAQPYAVVTKANPELVARQEAERKGRADQEVKRLQALYHITGDQEAIKHYQAVYDSNTVVLEKLEQAHQVHFIDNPPLTLDDELQYKQTTLAGNVPMVASVFNNMSSATVGVALNLNSVPRAKLVYLAILPDLLTQTGIVKNGKAVSYEQMIQQIQQQILSLRSWYSTNQTTVRAELVVEGAGNNQAEAVKSVNWMNDILQHPNWTAANLPRIRDLVDQSLSGIRKTMQGAEESWVNDPGDAYLAQDQPLHLATSSFLTRAYNIFRLKWLLKDGGDDATGKATANYLTMLKSVTGNRQQLKALLAVLKSDKPNADSAGVNKANAEAFIKLSPAAKALAKDAATDLEQMLNDIPDGSLTADWASLCETIKNDLAQKPETTLDDLNNLRISLLKTTQARMYQIGSAATAQKLNTPINQMLTGFSKAPAARPNNTAGGKLIFERAMKRLNTTEVPVFAGLINPDSHTGVFINTAPLTTFRDTAREKLLQLLAADLYGGAGKQSVYTKSTGAGLSYSTGVWVGSANGRFGYYAERTPELPQTLRFVIDEVKKAPVDTAITDYVVSLAVGYVRAADDYEARGKAMAANLVDGVTPDLIKRYRLAILKLRKEPGLVNQIYKYKDQVYEMILPGYGKPSKDVPGGSYFVIGPEKQMTAYEAYLKSTNGNDAKLIRLYPRDFWMVEAGQ
jgi:Zn-dependent M16 (insulinase) family peptidase